MPYHVSVRYGKADFRAWFSNQRGGPVGKLVDRRVDPVTTNFIEVVVLGVVDDEFLQRRLRHRSAKSLEHREGDDVISTAVAQQDRAGDRWDLLQALELMSQKEAQGSSTGNRFRAMSCELVNVLKAIRPPTE